MRPQGKRIGVAALLISALLSQSAYAGEWKQENETLWHYEEQDGSMLRDALSPDGYYLDGNGNWFSENSVLGVRLEAKNYFLDAAGAGDFEVFANVLTRAEHALDAVRGSREILVSTNAVIVYGTGKNQSRELLSVTRNERINGYTIRIGTNLVGEVKKSIGSAEEVRQSAYYDYQLLRLLLHVISRSGDQLSDAILSSWEESNRYGLQHGKWVRIGDAELLYQAENGAGKYLLRPGN